MLEQHKKQEKQEHLKARVVDVKRRLENGLHDLTEVVKSEIVSSNASATGPPWTLASCNIDTHGSGTSAVTVKYKYTQETSTYGSWVLNGLPKSTAVDTGTH